MSFRSWSDVNMGWIILAIILTVLFLLFNLYVKIQLIYIGGDLKVFLRILFLKFKIVPPPEEKTEQKPKKKKDKSKKAVSEEKPKEKKKNTFDDVMDIIESVKKIIGKVFYYFNKYLRFNVKALRIKVAAEDAAASALLCGLVSQGVAYLLEFIEEHVKKIKYKRNSVIVITDFISEEYEIQLDISVKIRIWQILALGVSVLKEFLLSLKKL